MRNLYTTLLILLVGFCSFAQNQSNQDLRNISAPMPDKTYTGTEIIPEFKLEELPFHTLKPQVTHYKNGDICETIMGTTTYDLQSNAAVSSRMVSTANGMSAVWTFSDENSTSWTDRGTGYNYFDGSAWGDLPTSRLESVRIGWPTLGVTAGGTEFAISHVGSGTLHMTSRSSQGSGTWAESEFPGTTTHLWPRACTGGSDNNSIHVVCVSTPVANGGTEFMGQDGALLYFRSQDQGANWDQVEIIIPGTEAGNFLGFDGDTYAIASNGDKVAIAVFGDLYDTFVLISDDNGDTWTKTTLVDFPVDNYVLDTGIDLDNDGIIDTLDNSDGAGTVIVDYSGNTQVFYGDMRYLDDDLGDGNFSYFPYTSGVWHWMEGMSEPVEIIDEIDLDGDPLNLDYVDLGLYFVSVTGFVNASSDIMGNTYLAFSSLMEGIDNGAQNYRHVYLMTTSDGTTWLGPSDMTPDSDGDETIECVFPTMAPFVDDRVQLWYQRDFEPGLAVRGDEDPVGLNDIVHLDIDASAVVSVAEPTLNVELDVFPVPSNGEMTITADLSSISYLNLTVVDVNGKRVYKDRILSPNYNLDLTNNRPGVYFLIFENEGNITSEKIVIK